MADPNPIMGSQARKVNLPLMSAIPEIAITESK